MKSLTRLFVLLAAALAGFAAHAQGDAFPSRPIRIVIPFAAGGTADPVARLLADVINKKTGANFVVDSVPGAGGNIGNQAVAKAPKDGHTVLLGANNNFVVNQHLFPTGSVDVLNDFALVTVLVDQPQVVYARADLPPTNLKELVDYVKQRPGKLNYASPGPGSAPHLAGEILSDLYGLDMVHVPFKGGAPAITALLAGDVQMYFASLSVGKGHLVTGKLKALATTASTRLAALPDVPTTTEAGMPGYQVTNWWALAAPKGTPAAAVEWIRREFTEAMKNPDVVKRFTDLGFVIVGNTPAQFEERVRRESAMYEKLVKSRKLSAQ